jgi:hypothetical protein
MPNDKFPGHNVVEPGDPVMYQCRGKGSQSTWISCAQAYAETQWTNPEYFAGLNVETRALIAIPVPPPKVK